MFAKVLFFCLIACSAAYLMHERPNPKRSADKCLPTSYNLGEMNYGEQKFPKGDCIRAECNNDGSVTYAGCGAVMVPDGCTLDKPDLTKHYPDCCPTTFTCA